MDNNTINEEQAKTVSKTTIRGVVPQTDRIKSNSAGVNKGGAKIISKIEGQSTYRSEFTLLAKNTSAIVAASLSSTGKATSTKSPKL